MIKRIIFLSIVCNISSITKSMDLAEYQAPQTIVTRLKDINNLYNKTSKLLQTFEANNEQSTASLAIVIEEAIALKSTQITPRTLGFHFLHQNQTFCDKFSSKVSPNKISPFHISAFFEILHNYDIDLTAAQLNSPNSAETHHHLNNKYVDKTAEICSLFGVTIPIATITAHKIIILARVGVGLFDTLIDNISKMLQHSTDTMKNACDLIYHNELMSSLTTSTK
jgi:hypothetical protein